ncbi:hypothetical protein [Lysobacter silvisoli]|uniref:hypothetical protein n=1 Tax=Lysobacter silvisoli TaxID=2293254 RepID=UPI0011C038ED|nr:hypothetical protein [Lysobacter silvisoli]
MSQTAQSFVIYRNLEGQQAIKFFVPSADPTKSSTTSAALGFGCATLLGVAFAGGVMAGVSAPTSPVVQIENKAIPHLLRSSKEAAPHADPDGASPDQWVQDIEWIRFQSDISVTALAGLFNVTRKTFYGWMSGEVVPRSHRIVRIAALRTALSLLPTREERNAVFGLLDRRTGSRVTIRDMLASNSEEDGVLDQLTDAIKEFDLHIQKGAARAKRTGVKSRAYESEFPAA